MKYLKTLQKFQKMNENTEQLFSKLAESNKLIFSKSINFAFINDFIHAATKHEDIGNKVKIFANIWNDSGSYITIWDSDKSFNVDYEFNSLLKSVKNGDFDDIGIDGLEPEKDIFSCFKHYENNKIAYSISISSEGKTANEQDMSVVKKYGDGVISGDPVLSIILYSLSGKYKMTAVGEHNAFFLVDRK